MSDTLTWLLTKNDSSFIVRRNGVEFSREKYNLTNLNTHKYSGLAAVKGVDVSLNDKKVYMTTKVAKRSNKPSKAYRTVPMNRCAKAVSKSMCNTLKKSYYRGDLKYAAVARWCRLNRLAKVEKGVVKAALSKKPRSQRA